LNWGQLEELLKSLPMHGYLLVAAICFLEAVGFPFPAALAILTAGALSAYGRFHIVPAFAVAFAGILAGDIVLFTVGRVSGWRLLGLLCRLSANPESCILRSAEYFYRRGKQTLLFAKFLPGVNTMSPPLAGSMKMPVGQFLRFDAAGAALYVAAYGFGGYVFSDLLRTLMRGLKSAGSAAELVFALGVAGYIGYRIWLFRKYRVYRFAPRIPVEDVARRLSSTEEALPLLVDVRSHGYYDADASRIKGSVRIEPNNLAEELKNLPKDRDIYLYCT
jgi:membrane protein DedA with SNARE-associated domain